MSGRPEEGHYGNEESQSPTVPRQDRRRLRLESNSDTDQPAATRRGAEERQRPQLTMSSSVEDILLEGSTLRNKMKLNEFLRSNLGGMAAVDEEHNVTMEAFVQDPETFIQNKRLLRTITALPSYSELEREMKRELDERKILLEAIYKLNRGGVLSLEQWRDYEGKDTVTPLPKAKLNRVLTQLLREGNREAEERGMREEEERQRRAQEMEFTISTTIEDVLFKGRVRVKDTKLNDFLTMEFGGKGIVATNRDVLLKEFFKEPARYIHDARVLDEIRATDRYLKMGRAVMDEVNMEEDVRMLHENGVFSLEQWREYEGKDTVTSLAKGKLNAALSRAQISTSVVKSTVLKGYYESVYNAGWSHVVEVPDGDEEEETEMGMEVRKGKPEQSWTYKKVGETLERNDSVQQSGEARLRLMVLTSDKGWPYSWEEDEFIRDCSVNCEVERAWQIVKGDLTEWFSPRGENKLTPGRHLVIGTPGIGKSMNAGSYLLYQLLHYDAKKLPVVLYVIGNGTFLFEKTTQTVTKYVGGASIDDVLDFLSDRGVNAYIIYDVAKEGRKPYPISNSRKWGMIVVTSPNPDNFGAWEKYKSPKRIIMNCPEKDDVKAMCVWMKRNDSGEQAEYWNVVNGRVDKVGPLLRYIFDDTKYNNRNDLCEDTVNSLSRIEAEYYLHFGTGKMLGGNNVSHKLVRIVRVRGGKNCELTFNGLMSPYLGNLTLCKLAELMMPNDFILLVLAIKDDLLSKVLEKYSVFTFLSEAFVSAIIPKLRELKLTENAPPHLCALREHPHERPLKPSLLPLLENFEKKINIECRVLYKPEAQNFPLLDAFFFVNSNPKTLVGLQITTAGEHHTIPSTVNLFNERMAEYFNGWEQFSEGLSWDIIYVQHADTTPLTGWQRCGPVNPNNLTPAEEEIVSFWNEKVHQYQVSVSSRDFRRDEAPRSVEEQQQQGTD
ncbi:retrotransposon hot spot (RHS) protein, putative [Trypanosoma cruzi]|uniref:Retrotransposon hot spot (RHS) protein, putative n=1 Tax=Trypanosoma cruzi (strain CL Brener) TaxID=353153 RepID=Q4E3H4_TRYCC|nr:retrotransposon hot spot (RHS) protein, putative [Trypanosoma cruzi]EAN99306.1 retrotransposon hot spot (RHS) protein, putative [Trypanosoma cruzi]|eukprot:XP_821157.1 retrotransposon hot spot (RHS) protein [Trypanosoma cruzi strain CL Brener]